MPYDEFDGVLLRTCKDYSMGVGSYFARWTICLRRGVVRPLIMRGAKKVGGA